MPKTLTRKHFEKYNPFRTAAWRHERVITLIGKWPRPGRPSRIHDDVFVHAYHNFMITHRVAVTDTERPPLLKRHKSIWLAWNFYTNAGMESREILEARILARESNQTIADRIDLTPVAVGWYERLYFNVRDRLNVRDWIFKTIHGTRPRRRLGCVDPLSEIERGTFYKLIGYFGGPVALDCAISALSGQRVAKPDEASVWLGDKMQSCISQLALLAISGETTANAMQYFRTHMRLANRRRNSLDSSPTIGKNLGVFFENMPRALADRQTSGSQEAKEGNNDG